MMTANTEIAVDNAAGLSEDADQLTAKLRHAAVAALPLGTESVLRSI